VNWKAEEFEGWERAWEDYRTIFEGWVLLLGYRIKGNWSRYELLEKLVIWIINRRTQRSENIFWKLQLWIEYSQSWRGNLWGEFSPILFSYPIIFSLLLFLNLSIKSSLCSFKSAQFWEFFHIPRERFLTVIGRESAVGAVRGGKGCDINWGLWRELLGVG
jgi:hypothetical protein